MDKLGKKQLTLILQKPLESLPEKLKSYELELADKGNKLVFTFHAERDRERVASLLRELYELQIDFKDLKTQESSLEDIFVSLVNKDVNRDASEPS